MSPNTMLALAAAAFSLALALAGSCRKKRSLSTWCFAVGMLVFALENLFGAMWREAVVAEKAAFWGSLTLVMKSLFPGIWICFSLTYSRGNARTVPLRSRLLILAALLIPVGISLIFRNQLLPVSAYADSNVRLVGSFARRGKNVEWDSARLRCSDSDEPGKNVPICCRHNAMENQIHRDRVGHHFRGPDLHCEPERCCFRRAFWC